MKKRPIRGYKVFDPDWTCRPNGNVFHYKVGETYEMDCTPIVCSRGFHFCKKAADCFNYYLFDPRNKVAEVIAVGDVVSDGLKSCTNKIKIVREIPWSELLDLINTGAGNNGLGNTGDRNTGDWNTGDWNTGNWNIGDRNTGDRNTGNCNTGNWNTGNWNTGNWNTGHWNTGDCNAGCFNTDEPMMRMFNKQSSWTFIDWLKSDAKRLMCQMPMATLEYCCFNDMSDSEKADHPEAEITGGYLKVTEPDISPNEWWRGLSDSGKKAITSLPNFDAGIFKEITGIDVHRM